MFCLLFYGSVWVALVLFLPKVYGLRDETEGHSRVL